MSHFSHMRNWALVGLDTGASSLDSRPWYHVLLLTTKCTSKSNSINVRRHRTHGTLHPKSKRSATSSNTVRHTVTSFPNFRRTQWTVLERDTPCRCASRIFDAMSLRSAQHRWSLHIASLFTLPLWRGRCLMASMELGKGGRLPRRHFSSWI